MLSLIYLNHLSINLFSNTSLGVLSLIHDAKVRGFWISCSFYIQKPQKNALFLIHIKHLCAYTPILWSHTTLFQYYLSVPRTLVSKVVQGDGSSHPVGRNLLKQDAGYQRSDATIHAAFYDAG